MIENSSSNETAQNSESELLKENIVGEYHGVIPVLTSSEEITRSACIAISSSHLCLRVIESQKS